MFRVFPSNRASPGGHASTTKKEIKTVKKSVCPAIVLDTFCFLLKRRLREISTYYFVFFFFFKCVFLLLLFIKSALFFLNSRVCFCLTEQTQRESVCEIVNVKANSTIIRTVTRFEVNSRLLPQNNVAL